MRAVCRRMAQRLIRTLPRRLNGFLVRAAKDFVPDSVRGPAGLLNAQWSLRNAATNGFQPGAIVDVGACQGLWSQTASALFPQARVLMIEANPDCRDALADVAARLPGARYEVALLGPREEEGVPFFQMHEGSSVLEELTDAPRRTIRLKMRTLDGVVAPHQLPPPLLLKLDVQGYELAVLEGAPATIARTDAVFMETSFLPYNQGAPLFADVVACMRRLGFVVYDLCSTCRRASDRALFQGDVLFVREGSALRKPRPFFS